MRGRRPLHIPSAPKNDHLEPVCSCVPSVARVSVVSREKNEYESDKEEEEEDDYVNVVNTVDHLKKQRGAAKVVDGDNYEEVDSAEDHNYEETTPRTGFAEKRPVHFKAESSEQEEGSSDDEGNYENVSQPFTETEVYICWKQEDIYQNL